MPYWVVADTSESRRALFGPYNTESRAEQVKDGLDDGNARVYQTVSSNRGEAGQEIRHQRSQENGVGEVYKNFSHKGLGG